jgi:hypothetical protein
MVFVRIITLCSISLLFVATPVLYADTLQMSIASNGTWTVNGTVTIGGSSLTSTLFCDDYTHDIYAPNAPTTYTYNITNIATLTSNFSKTLYGSLSGATSLYEQIFYLSTLETAAIQSNDITSANDIQEAMWTLSYPDEANKDSVSGPPTSSVITAYVTQAQQNYSKYLYSNFTILTLQDPSSPTTQQQELFYMTGSLISIPTPEPKTAILLIASLGCMALISRPRTKS